MNSTTEVLAEEWLKTYVKRGEAITESKGCELPSGDNLRKGDVVHIRARFIEPSRLRPCTHGVFDAANGDSFIAPFAEIVDVELPSLAIGDRVVTPDGKYGTVIALENEFDGAYVETGESVTPPNGCTGFSMGQSIARYWPACKLTRAD